MRRRELGRFFLVGTPRSGTTLLQAMLSAHPRVYSPPETHFFRTAVGKRRRNRLFGIAAPRKAHAALISMLERLDRLDLDYMVPQTRLRFASYATAFISILDELAVERGATLWVEKTPDHLRSVPVIQRAVKGARFIHILRDGRDVAASLYSAAQQGPSEWAGRPVNASTWPIERCVQRWNDDLLLSLHYARSPSHLVVRYDHLVGAPADILNAVCSYLDIKFDSVMLSYHAIASDVLGSKALRSPWRRDVLQPLKDTHLRKFNSVFTPEERSFVETALISGGQLELALEAEAQIRPRGLSSS